MEKAFTQVYIIRDIQERMKFLVDQISRITGLSDFGTYVCQQLTIDAFFLNEDRHTHNMAVLIDTKGDYQYCPIFESHYSYLRGGVLY